MAFDLDKYALVADRLAQFYKDHRDGSIQTFLVVRDGPEVIVEARLYRTREDACAGIYTSGLARELEGSSHINQHSHLENCESSAIGRALANAGYSASKERPSREEMLRVERRRDEHERIVNFLTEVGRTARDEDTIPGADGQRVSLKHYLRRHWRELRERPTRAREIVDVVETHTAYRLHGPAEQAA